MKFLRGILLTAGAILILAATGFYFRPLDFYDNYTWLEEAIHGVENRWVWVDGHRLHYEVEGPIAGQPVVLVHGLGGRADNWRALAPYLARGGYRVYMPDLIGYGRSDQPQNFSYSIRDEAKVVIDLLDEVGLKRVDLGGWSMGGWIVQVAAFQHPDRIKRLMIFDSAGLYAVPDWDTRLFMPENVDQLTKLNALLMPHPPALPGFIAADILRLSRQTNWVVERALAQMFTGRDVTDAMLPKIKVPLLIEWGALDQIIPVKQAQKIHQLVPQSELHLYSTCGHLAPLQCADQMGPDIVRDLARTPVNAILPEANLAAQPEPAKQQPRAIAPAHLQAATISASAPGAN